MTIAHDSQRIGYLLPKYFEATHPNLKIFPAEDFWSADPKNPLTGYCFTVEVEDPRLGEEESWIESDFKFRMLLDAGEEMPEALKNALAEADKKKIIRFCSWPTNIKDRQLEKANDSPSHRVFQIDIDGDRLDDFADILDRHLPNQRGLPVQETTHQGRLGKTAGMDQAVGQ